MSEEVLETTVLGTRLFGAATRPPISRARAGIGTFLAGTPFRPGRARIWLGNSTKTRRLPRQNAAESSPAGACSVRSDEPLRQKVIGHRMAVARRRRGNGLGLRRSFGTGGADAAFPLLDQPAGNHGVGVLVEPLIEERRDLLAEIGSVGEAGEFVRLQGVAGSSEEELPGRLGALVDHVHLQYVNGNVRRGYSSTKHSMITSNCEVYSLWKAVEIEEKVLEACSGCAGDYEDPDRTAWEGESEEEDAEEAGDEPGSDA